MWGSIHSQWTTLYHFTILMASPFSWYGSWYSKVGVFVTLHKKQQQQVNSSSWSCSTTFPFNQESQIQPRSVLKECLSSIFKTFTDLVTHGKACQSQRLRKWQILWMRSLDWFITNLFDSFLPYCYVCVDYNHEMTIPSRLGIWTVKHRVCM